MLGFDEARARLLSLAPRLGSERVGLEEAAGRVLAEELRAPFDLPAFDYSAMDGYAVRTSDFPGEAPWSLPVRGESKTGGVAPALAPGSVCRIFTGAELPAGADAVVMQEQVERVDDDATFRKAPAPGANVRRKGEDLARGAVALTRGLHLSPSRVALAAAVDRAWVQVARRPVVTILRTGDELRAPGSPPLPGTIPESNGVALRAVAGRAGALARLGPFVRDDLAATERAFRDALAGTDVLVTVGGVSVGTHDVVRPALERVGVTLDFWKVSMKPGRPLAVGRHGEAVVLGLPGNPVSALVTFGLFGVPLLRAMQGDASPLPEMDRARLARPVRHEPGRTEFLRARVARQSGGLLATALLNQASGAVTSLAEANALAVIAADRAALEAGDEVDVLWLHDLGL